MADNKDKKVLNVPALRFPEFTDEWKEVLFASNLERLENGANYNTNDKDGVPMSRIETISTGRIDYTKVGHCSTPQKIEHYIMRYGDILFSHINSLKHIGKTAYYSAEEPLYHGMNLLLFRCKNNVDSKFFFFLINNTHFIRKCQILAKQAVNQASISTSDLKKIKVYIPDINEQSKIQKFLSLIEKRIELQNKIIEDLKKLKSALYQEMFGSLVAPTLKLGQVAEIVKGKQVNGTELLEQGDYYVMNGGTLPSGWLNNFNTEANTISISEGGNSCGYVQYNTSPYWSGGHCYSLKILHPKKTSDLYLYHFLKWQEENIMALRIGSSLPNIQKKDLLRFPIILPTITQQNKIVSILSAIEVKVSCEISITKYFIKQKEYLLGQLFI